jgi:hypothetical protein
MDTRLRREFLRQVSTLGAAGALGGSADAAQGGGAPAAAGSGSAAMWPVSEAERSASVAPLSLQFAPGDIRRYGADPTGTRDSTQAFIDANAMGNRGGGPIRIPAGKYKYVPSSRLDIGVSWLGDGAHSTLILCDTSKHTGDFFRIVGSTVLSDVLISAVGAPKVGTGVRLAPADAGQFTGQVRLTRVWVFGFNYNIQCDNNFEATFDQVRCEAGNEGFYCAPESGAGNGYCTTHLHLNCYYGQNARNVLYSPGMRQAFRSITFLGGSIEGALGSSSQSSFTRCSPLKFVQIYLEAAPKVPALVLNDCMVSIDGAYLNGTGGIRVGPNCRVDLRHIVTMTATDVFSGADGSQQVAMQDCSWPASGNELKVASLSLRNSSINGNVYRDYAPEISSLGATRFSRQTTVVAANAAQDVYRFVDLAGEVSGGSVSGRFEIIARDKGDGSNQALYEYWLGSASGGPAHASLVLLRRLVRGTDVGASEEPLALAGDGDRGGVKLQFVKNSGISQVIVDVLFNGITTAK